MSATGAGGGAVVRTVGRGTGGLLLGTLMGTSLSNDRSARRVAARSDPARGIRVELWMWRVHPTTSAGSCSVDHRSRA